MRKTRIATEQSATAKAQKGRAGCSRRTPRTRHAGRAVARKMLATAMAAMLCFWAVPAGALVIDVGNAVSGEGKVSPRLNRACRIQPQIHRR